MPSDLPYYDFEAARQSIRSLLLQGTPAIGRLLEKIHSECAHVINDMSLFQLRFSKSMRMDEFEHIQTYHRQSFTLFLRDT
jgi:hypothetical protein